VNRDVRGAEADTSCPYDYLATPVRQYYGLTKNALHELGSYLAGTPADRFVDRTCGGYVFLLTVSVDEPS
jgi:hypothetical protein